MHCISFKFKYIRSNQDIYLVLITTENSIAYWLLRVKGHIRPRLVDTHWRELKLFVWHVLMMYIDLKIKYVKSDFYVEY